MAGISTIIAGVGVAAGIAGTAVSFMGAQQQAAGQRKALAAQQRAEALRERQMEIDSSRKKRQMVREQQVARSQALSAATAQGSQQGSGLAGVYGSISGQTGVNQLGVSQNREIGAGIFAENRQATAGNMMAASGAGMAAMGQGISSLGGALVSNAGTIGRIGTYFSSSRVD